MDQVGSEQEQRPLWTPQAERGAPQPSPQGTPPPPEGWQGAWEVCVVRALPRAAVSHCPVLPVEKNDFTGFTSTLAHYSAIQQ